MFGLHSLTNCKTWGIGFNSGTHNSETGDFPPKTVFSTWTHLDIKVVLSKLDNFPQIDAEEYGVESRLDGTTLTRPKEECFPSQKLSKSTLKSPPIQEVVASC